MADALPPIDAADSILDLVGHTPLVRLPRVCAAEGVQCTLVAKLETTNPGGSVKDRVAVAMIDAAERDGLLEPGRNDRRADVGQHRIRVSRSSPRSAATAASS